MKIEMNTKENNNLRVFVGDQYKEYLRFKRNSNNLSKVIRIVTEIFIRYSDVKSKRKIM